MGRSRATPQLEDAEVFRRFEDTLARGPRGYLDGWSATLRRGVRSATRARTSTTRATLPTLRAGSGDVTKGSTDLGPQSFRARFGSTRVSDEHDIHWLGEPVELVARRFSQPPLDAVSRDRIAHLSTYCQPHPARSSATTRQPEHQDGGAPDLVSTPLNPSEIR